VAQRLPKRLEQRPQACALADALLREDIAPTKLRPTMKASATPRGLS
jgi:hypothetical protein